MNELLNNRDCYVTPCIADQLSHCTNQRCSGGSIRLDPMSRACQNTCRPPGVAKMMLTLPSPLSIGATPSSCPPAVHSSVPSATKLPPRCSDHVAISYAGQPRTIRNARPVDCEPFGPFKHELLVRRELLAPAHEEHGRAVVTTPGAVRPPLLCAICASWQARDVGWHGVIPARPPGKSEIPTTGKGSLKSKAV